MLIFYLSESQGNAIYTHNQKRIVKVKKDDVRRFGRGCVCYMRPKLSKQKK